MKLSDLIDKTDMTAPEQSNAKDIDVTGLTADSRSVRPGFLFASLPGSRVDGRQFIPAALNNGALVILAPPGTKISDLPPSVTLVHDENPRRRLALMAARFYGVQPEFSAAVTGTNGKTSVAVFARQIWTHLGRSAASLGTLGLHAPNRTVLGGLTTPDPVALHDELATLANDGVTRLAMEASSHGLDQYRLDGVRFSAAAFTNLSRDHLDYHPDMAAYMAAKARLFAELLAPGATAVLNADAPEFEALSQTCAARGVAVSTYGAAGRDLCLHSATPTPTGQDLTVIANGAAHAVHLPLAGTFQAWNALAAAGLVIASGEEIGATLNAFSRLIGVPGRMERVAQTVNGASVYVDYAHTPDALATALNALRPHVPEGSRLVVVFGCGGDRDPGKRPQMGEIAAKGADAAIVTDDNPRTEDPAAIRAAIMAACPNAQNIGERARAIKAGIDAVTRGDILLIAGKGHEEGQIVGTEVRPFNDVQVARAIIDQSGGTA